MAHREMHAPTAPVSEAALGMMAAGQAMTLALLRDEMMALWRVMPGGATHDPHAAETEAQIEADFDNMPV